MKRLMAISLALAMLLALAACSGGTPAASAPAATAAATAAAKTAAPAATTAAAAATPAAPAEKVKFTATFLQNDWHALPTEMAIFDELADMANVEVEWQVYANATWNEKKQLILAGGDLPDVFYMNALNGTDVVQYSAQGALIDLTDLIEQYCPRLSAIFEEMPNYKAVCTDQDTGKIFKVARAAERNVHYTTALDYINTDWLEKFNLSMPATIDEFESALKTMVQGDANGNGQTDELGYVFHGNLDKWDGAYTYTNFFGAFGQVFDPSYVIKDENGKLVFIANTEEYKNALIWLNHMAQEGLLDIEGLTTVNTTTLNAKGNAATPIVCSFSAFDETFVIPTDRYDSYDVIGALAGPTGERHNIWAAASNGNISGQQFIMTVAAKGKEAAIMNWLDCHFDEKMSIQLFLGPIGVTLKETASGMLDYIDTPAGMSYSEFRYGNCPVHVPCIIRAADWGKTIQVMGEDINKLSIAEKYYRPYADQSNIFAMWNSKETDYIANEGLDLKTYCNQMHAKWIVEGGIEADWDAYCAQLDKLGWQEYLATYQGMHDRISG